MVELPPANRWLQHRRNSPSTKPPGSQALEFVVTSANSLWTRRYTPVSIDMAVTSGAREDVVRIGSTSSLEAAFSSVGGELVGLTFAGEQLLHGGAMDDKDLDAICAHETLGWRGRGEVFAKWSLGGTMGRKHMRAPAF